MGRALEHSLLAITLATQLLLVASLVISMAWPAHRIWPPPGPRSWQLVATWLGSWIGLSGAFLLAVLGENTLGLPTWLRFGVGVPLLLAGSALLVWAMRTLGRERTLGLRGPLVRSGPYRWSRNPQYVGACLYLASLAVLSGSALAAIACAAVAAWFLAAPFAEEPWLREQYGDAYDAWCREVPRFVGRRRRVG